MNCGRALLAGTGNVPLAGVLDGALAPLSVDGIM